MRQLFARLVRRLLLRPNLGGLVVGLLFWWRSLSPLLLPRSWIVQAMVGSLSLAVGYMLGTLIGYWVHSLLERLHRQPGPTLRRRVWIGFAAVSAAVVVVGSVMWPRWQNDHRKILTMGPTSSSGAVPMLLLTVFLTLVLAFGGRFVWAGVRWIDRRLSRYIPRSAAIAITAIVVVVAAQYIVIDVAGNGVHNWANSAFGVIEEDTIEGLDPPTSETVSGSPDSLVPWNLLGRQGRNFVTEATPADELQAFVGPDAAVVEPIRVYVGLRSADSAEERAAIAVRELERTGGFDRKVLAVWTVTGTGWVDPDAAVVLEQMYGGDTAIVSMQYSFLPSWISTLVDGPAAQEAGAELFDAVHERWAQLPESSRPKLVVFGLSLGSYGGEAAFAGNGARNSVANLVNRTDGALFVGPTNGNEVWSKITAARDSGSPEWQPVFDDGQDVRFANAPSELTDAATADWGPPRILYLQHPTDPVTFWSMDTMWSSPDWIDDPTGAGVAEQASWFPFVTFAQLVADLSAGFGAEPGFGHDYTNGYVAAWAAVLPPEGWTDQETSRLETFLDVPA